MSNWKYKGRELLDSDVPESAVGFIYLITQLSTGRRYLGKKLLTKSATKTIKGKKKKIRKESDWREYWSSSPQIKAWIEEAGGTQDFTKEILTFCSSRGSISYCEEMSLFYLRVLESDDWINKNIRSRIYSTWVKVDDANSLRESLSKL